MSREANSRTSRRSSSKAVMEAGNAGDRYKGTEDTLIQQNLEHGKIDTKTKDQIQGRSPEFKMQLRHKPKRTDSMEWQFTPSPSSRENKATGLTGKINDSKERKKNSPSLSDTDEFFDPFKSPPSDDTNIKLEASPDSANPVDAANRHAATFSRDPLPSHLFSGSGRNDLPQAHLSQIFQTAPFSPGTLHYNTKAHDSWQQREQHWPTSPPSKTSIQDSVSPLVKPRSEVPFSSPPPKKRRYLSSTAEQAPDSGSTRKNVFRSPTADQWLFAKSPFKDSDANFPGMSFGFDTPSKNKFDDLMPQASFDAMPFPVTGEDSRSPFIKGMSSQSALDFAAKFGLSQSYSIDEGVDANLDELNSHPSGHNVSSLHPPLVPSMSPFRSQRTGQYLSSVRHQQHLQAVEIYPHSFMSPPHPTGNFQYSSHIALPQFPPSQKNQRSPESADKIDYRNVYRPMVGHPHFIPPSNDHGQPTSNLGARDAISPGLFRVKIGNVGSLQQAEARRGMEGINTMMKEVSSQSSQSSKSSVFSPIMKGILTSNTSNSVRQDIQTPLRAHPHISGPISTSGTYTGPHPNVGSATSIRSISSLPTRRYPNFLSPSPHVSSSTRNVNDSGIHPGATRNPCNCKKCKCLKLYCECFAGDIYCEGCNCNDCNNIPAFDSVRDKAKHDTIAKNPNAFKKKITESESPMSASVSPQQVHNMGCRCKKSSCLMKYCECFQSNIFCGGKCKCSVCKNFYGSQALIDRRRKIKDSRGAEKALRSADDLWQTNTVFSEKPSMSVTKTPAQSHPVSQRFLTPASYPSYPNMGNSIPPPGSSATPVLTTHPFMSQKPSVRVAPMGYTPSGMKPTPPAFVTDYRGPYSQALGKMPNPFSSSKLLNQTPQLKTPQTPKKRRRFDFHQVRRTDLEQPCSLFGSHVPISKGVALQIFSFLPNDAIYNASLVNREWNKISLDDELWHY